MSLALALLTFGCAPTPEIPPDASAVLRNGTNLELFSLDPRQEDAIRNRTYQGDLFAGWAVLGSTIIDDAASRTELLDALEEGVAASRPNTYAECFWPRHGIRVRHGGQQHDFLICFECIRVRWLIEGNTQASFGVTRIPQPTFDKVLEDAGVPLPEQRQSQ